MRPTIKDVARLAGVSTATVSRVLSDRPIVTQETRQKVLQAVEELGYRPSRIARGLRMQRSQIIGVIISDIQNPFFTALVRAVEDVTMERNYSVILCNSDENVDKERRYLELMRSEHAAGIILTPASEEGTFLSRLLHEDISVVAVDRRVTDCEIDTVLLDNVQAAFALAEHLVENGHRRVGVVVGLETNTTGKERVQGFRQALATRGITLDSALTYQVLPKIREGYQAVCAMLSLPRPPTAILTGNNFLMTGALQAIRERELRIPQDVALASFDELPSTSLVEPGITVIEQPVYEMGSRAAQLLFQRMDDPALPIQHIRLSGKLIVRGSSGPHRETTT